MIFAIFYFLQDRVPLYEGSRVSREEAYVLILNFVIRHHLTDIALEHLISLLDILLSYKLFCSKYMFLKEYENNQNSIFKCYYCPDCHNILNIDDRNKKNEIFTCTECNKRHLKSMLTKNMHYYLRIPLEKQLQDIINSDKYNLFQVDNSYSDVTSGTFYKTMVENGVISKQDITLQFNTDGIQLFRSSPMSLWPIQVSINELPYRERKENMILCGLWYGPNKPNMHLFLKYFVEELITLHETGITRCVGEQEIKIKVHTIASPVDSIARPVLQDITQLHGQFGCSFCLHEGQQVPIKRGMTRLYPGDLGIPRTIDQHERDCQEAMRIGKPVRGVKGPSILMLLPVFNIISSFTPDYLHSVLLGVVKTFTDAWFDSANHEKNWYLGLKIPEFNSKLLQIKPPREITRTPRSITDRKYWKGSEWKNFLLYYSLVCLENLMPRKYVQHWYFLVFSMHIFLKKKINKEDFNAGKNALRAFVLKINDMYGIEFYKFNIHLMLHIPDSVMKFGALWASSTFPFEHYNGVLSSMFRNSQAVPEQICKSYSRLKSAEKLSWKVFSHRNCPKDVKILHENMCGIFRLQRCIEYGPHLRLFGMSKQVQLPLIIKTAIEVYL